jgi:uncharacterized protein (DUF362 family)
MINSKVVAIHRSEASYPPRPPFHPAAAYPERYLPDTSPETGNLTYAAVRELFRLLGWDAQRFDHAEWNPLGELITPGDHVVIKLNLIAQAHRSRPAEWDQVVTHPAVVRAVVDFALKALHGKGRVTIADAPQTDSDFELIRSRTGLGETVRYFRERSLPVELLDLRRDRWLQKNGVTHKRDTLPGDPEGYVNIRLDQASEFRDYRLSGRFYGADYDSAETRRFHSDSRHEYVLSKTILGADVLINLAKMKTHKKTGVTLSLKNMVGANGYRNCLPHYTIGTPEEGGDEFPTSSLSNRTQSKAIAAFKRSLVKFGGCGGRLMRASMRLGRATFGDTSAVIRSGNWHGNDTAWRMVLDLNKCLFSFGADGEPRRRPLRYLALVDGVIAGDGNGPLEPDRKTCGVLVAGVNPVAVDTVCAEVMGFDYSLLPSLRDAWRISNLPLVDFESADIRCASNVPDWDGPFTALRTARHLGFRPHFGWTGHIEKNGARLSANLK